jgi:alanyl-tRNA synthetase
VWIPPLQVGDTVSVHVDYDRRSFVAPNHTMTHVLNYALRHVLIGNGRCFDYAARRVAGVLRSDACLERCLYLCHTCSCLMWLLLCAAELTSEGLSQCDQKGSLVDTEKLRFDFSWPTALTPAQIAQVESIVVERIQAALPVHAQLVPLADASKIAALRQVFGERYPDPVRVISVGQDVQQMLADPTKSEWSNFAIEFCGGTHLTNTTQAEDFVIVEESGIAKVRTTAYCSAVYWYWSSI